MNQKTVLKLLSLIVLLIPVVCFSLDTQQSKPTKEILKQIANTKQQDLWGKREGIPERGWSASTS